MNKLNWYMLMCVVAWIVVGILVGKDAISEGWFLPLMLMSVLSLTINDGVTDSDSDPGSSTEPTGARLGSLGRMLSDLTSTNKK